MQRLAQQRFAVLAEAVATRAITASSDADRASRSRGSLHDESHGKDRVEGVLDEPHGALRREAVENRPPAMAYRRIRKCRGDRRAAGPGFAAASNGWMAMP